jgi:hypothetical protein
MRWLSLCLLLVLAGCAKLPAGGGTPSGKRLIITMIFDSEVKENFIYIVPLRVSNQADPTDDGPFQVVQAPWGNGFVAGNATHFIRWEPARPRPFVLYRFNDPSLLSFTEIGLIENYDEIPLDDPNVEQSDRKRIRFEVEVNTLAATPAAAALLQSVQINFLTMEAYGSGTSSRDWDALGDGFIGERTWAKILLNTAAIYSNSGTAPILIEPPTIRDTTDPSLDLVDWQVEVRLQ